MTAFAACLFAVAAYVSAHVIAASWLRHAGAARALQAQLRECTDTVALGWKVVERVPLPALSMLRKDRSVRPRRQSQWTVAERPGLEWPEYGAELAA
ncbi:MULTISPECIES: hypothetical protein [Novosphingobium]|jgi:hypothetical protein|uniref:hypothetical protein n=1 Tax=Novosphingobium sp. TCA1 TaxID=2682474 RepID=UPI00105642E1|nr:MULTISPECIES: hypothetical protein [Novosphingobium]GFE72431.1 hypothetical protein NTCA1_00800 [Novosphingobium sp. TCA1]